MSIHLVLSFENHLSLSVLSALAVIDGVEEVKVQMRPLKQGGTGQAVEPDPLTRSLSISYPSIK